MYQHRTENSAIIGIFQKTKVLKIVAIIIVPFMVYYGIFYLQIGCWHSKRIAKASKSHFPLMVKSEIQNKFPFRA
ncbi:hypothetical protein KsCSTR_37850 [Candidatus Kuenenia stuttgartiensis]|uniref:Uncharacterized protein n=1 Tax=Kuenenia stuttgartiensis TaxID=174633 RepID=Q1Q635_KUEST|nr:hypothetical protein KsCSTR_37850 [Candidatus Kuenenia stuttgartiensis]TVM02393.1 MAG: hypothetical protein CV080_00995 [Candidatus Kuenenia stuttgartiensis]CAJ73036.1 unknown protein [Candidatus Kuenenia stuttgartiensis]